VKKIYDEITNRFPEVNPLICKGDEELSYLLMGYVAEWLDSFGESGYSTEVIQRVVDFQEWCCTQPEGKSAEDDIHTIFIVGFYENLFGNHNTRGLIPHLMSKEEILKNKDYLIHWAGKDEYEAVLKLYK
jgi:hypothetical protein